MFGESTHALTNGWCDFVEQNIDQISRMIENPTARKSLEMLTVEQGFNEKCIVTFSALHYLNKPASVGYKAKRWTPTRKLSKYSVFKMVPSKNSIAKAICARNKTREVRSINNHPLIYGIGEAFDEISEFFVALGNVLYACDTFLEAIDMSFKCYKVLKIPFPPESNKFWQLINLLFYKIKSKQPDMSVMTIVNSLTVH